MIVLYVGWLIHDFTAVGSSDGGDGSHATSQHSPPPPLKLLNCCAFLKHENFNPLNVAKLNYAPVKPANGVFCKRLHGS